jgi:predicted enzyme related to lactoylglutathione lyase
MEATAMCNVIDWFEIPTVDFERAVRFYEVLLGKSLRREAGDGPPQALFVNERGGADGAVIRDPHRRPNPDGALVYLRAPDGVDACLERAAAAGGRVVLPRTDIGDPGFIAIVADTEGNHVGLHMERAEGRS